MTLFGRFENDYNFDNTSEWKLVGRCCGGAIQESPSPSSSIGYGRKTMSQLSRQNKRGFNLEPSLNCPISTTFPPNPLTNPVNRSVPSPTPSSNYYSNSSHGQFNVSMDSYSEVSSCNLYATGLMPQNHGTCINNGSKSGSDEKKELRVTPSNVTSSPSLSSSSPREKKKPKWLVQLIKKKKAEEARMMMHNNVYENMDYIKSQTSPAQTSSSSSTGAAAGDEIKNGCFSINPIQEKHEHDDYLNPVKIEGVKSISRGRMSDVINIQPSNLNSGPREEQQKQAEGSSELGFWRVIPSSSSSSLTFQPVIEIPDDDYEVGSEGRRISKRGESTLFHCFNPKTRSRELREGKEGGKMSTVGVPVGILKDHEKYYNIHELCQIEKGRKNEGQKEVINRKEDHNHHPHHSSHLHPHQEQLERVKRGIYERKIQDEVEENKKFSVVQKSGSTSRSGDHLNHPHQPVGSINKFNNGNNSKTTTATVSSTSSPNRAVSQTGPVRGILKKKEQNKNGCILKNDSTSCSHSVVDTTNCSLFTSPSPLTPPASSPSPSSHVDPSTIFPHSSPPSTQNKESEHEVPLFKTKITISNKPDPTTKGGGRTGATAGGKGDVVTRHRIVLSHCNSNSAVSTENSPKFHFTDQKRRLNHQKRKEKEEEEEEENRQVHGNGINLPHKREVNESRLGKHDKGAKLNQSSSREDESNSFQSKTLDCERTRAPSSLPASSSEISISQLASSSIATFPGTQIVSNTQQVAEGGRVRKSAFNDPSKLPSCTKSLLTIDAKQDSSARHCDSSNKLNHKFINNNQVPPTVKYSNNVETEKNNHGKN